MAEYDRLAQALCSVTVQAGDAAVPVVADILLGTLAAHRIRIPRIVLRIRQAPHTVVGVGIGVGAVRVGERRFGNVPVPTRSRAWFLGRDMSKQLFLPKNGQDSGCHPKSWPWDGQNFDILRYLIQIKSTNSENGVNLAPRILFAIKRSLTFAVVII